MKLGVLVRKLRTSIESLNIDIDSSRKEQAEQIFPFLDSLDLLIKENPALSSLKVPDPLSNEDKKAIHALTFVENQVAEIKELTLEGLMPIVKEVFSQSYKNRIEEKEGGDRKNLRIKLYEARRDGVVSYLRENNYISEETAKTLLETTPDDKYNELNKAYFDFLDKQMYDDSLVNKSFIFSTPQKKRLFYMFLDMQHVKPLSLFDEKSVQQLIRKGRQHSNFRHHLKTLLFLVNNSNNSLEK